MKKILFILVSLIMSISVFAKAENDYYYSEGIADKFSTELGYVLTSMKYYEEDNLIITELTGNWESIGVSSDIHKFAKIAVDRFLLRINGHTNVQGWRADSYGLTRQIKVKRNLIEFRIYNNHDKIYVFEYINKYNTSKTTNRSARKSKRTKKH